VSEIADGGHVVPVEEVFDGGGVHQQVVRIFDGGGPDGGPVPDQDEE
jgi:hypothetical protein